MKISHIAARLREVALELDDLAQKHDFDFPDVSIFPMIQNAFADLNLLKAFISDASPSSDVRHPETGD